MLVSVLSRASYVYAHERLAVEYDKAVVTDVRGHFPELYYVRVAVDYDVIYLPGCGIRDMPILNKFRPGTGYDLSSH